MTLSERRLALVPVAFYLVLVVVLVAGVLATTHGHFVYALDDPYIHLAMAENLAHGHYGINAGEFSSPSSSIVWPFLLVPFAETPVHVFVPLALNLLFGCVAALLLGRVVSGWRMAWWQRAITGAALVLAADLPSLTIIGMEHTLQVMLAIACASGLLEVLDGGELPGWSLAAAVVAPIVRYEDVALTLAVCVGLVGMKRWKASFAVGGLAMAPLIAFSVFLKQLGLPALPLSVLVKGDVSEVSDLGVRIRIAFETCVLQAVKDPERYPVLVLFLVLTYMTIRSRARAQRFVLGGSAMLAALQLLIGRFGWLYRYEVYAVIFLTLICMHMLARCEGFRFWHVSLVVGAATFSMIGTARTVGASSGIYRQQYQMHRFVTGFYRGDYAVNDLGLVSFERRPGSYVLDIYGLASLQAAQQDDKTTAWLDRFVKRRGVALVMMYPEWFDDVPDSWTELGRMCEADPPVSIGEGCVSFYSSTTDGTPVLREEVRAFAKTLPAGVTLTQK
ncbi:hypothetical protein [Granulicella sibirica]|uniref:Glycosyltransferase RgtA/B/C/D-like domain-containing protein n=1 Tax=Granulicella sibirica TaxID=2479048 RepID=A0A4Q0T3W2_9BACT|nr:hypothetical protein [Granulicella sibirica]RXH57210.1 putative membrane protein of unknown function [Granulicella sibirica]